jgi:hypothetical protein
MLTTSQRLFDEASGFCVQTPELRLQLPPDNFGKVRWFNRMVSPSQFLIENVELEKVIGQHRMDVVCEDKSGKKSFF